MILSRVEMSVLFSHLVYQRGSPRQRAAYVETVRRQLDFRDMKCWAVSCVDTPERQLHICDQDVPIGDCNYWALAAAHDAISCTTVEQGCHLQDWMG